MSNILTGFNMQGNDPIDNRIVSPSKFETLEEYLQRVPIQKRYYGLSFYALDENNELRHYTFQTSLIEPTIDDDEEEIERLDKELQEHVNNKEIHKTSEEIRSEIVDADIPDTIARVQWTLNKIEEAVNTVMNDIVDGASDEYNTLKKIQDKIVELRAEMESQLYGDDGGEVLKTLEQALKFLNQYKDFIVDIPDNYVNKQDIVDNLNTDDPTKVLSARQGKVLSETLTNYFDSAMASIRAETNRATNAENRIEAKLDDEIDRSTAEDIRIQSELDAEEARAQSEEKRIEDKLDAEIERSTTKDTELGNQIIAETNRAEGEEQRIETKLDNEITRSTAKDDEHDDRIKALEGDTHVQNTDVGTTSQTFQLQLGKPGNKIKNEDAAISVRNADDSDYVNFIAKNATFKGDLIVEGQSFVTEAETVEIKDNLLLLNKGEVGAGVTKGIAGLEIDRGTEPNYQIIFDESDNRFKAGEIGDIQCLALRDGDGDMLDGMFTTWDSTTHRLKTTNIIPNTRKLFFNDNTNSLEYTYQTYEENTYGNDSFTFTTASGSLYISAGNNNLNLGTDKTYFRFYKNLFIPSSIISSGTSISLLNASGATIATFGSPSTINSSLNVANQVIIKGGSNTKLILQSSDADNFNLIESQNSSGTILSKLGYYGTFWGIDNKKIATEEFANNKFLPLAGGTMTGVILMNNNVVIQSKNSSGTAKRLIGKGLDNVTYIGDSDGHTFLYSDAADIIHVRNDTNYTIYDSYNLTNPVTYTTDTYNYATLRNKDGQYFTYIKAGTNGLLPHSKATLVSGGSGSLGTSDQSFNAAYINNLHTNKVTFGDAGSFIDNQSGDSSHIGIGFYTSQNAVCPVYVGSLCVSDGYANSAPNIPTNGIYSKGVIKSAAGFTSNFRQTNLNLAKTGNDVLYISSFTVDATGSPGTDSNTGKNVNDGMFLTYFWVNDNAFQLAADIDGTGIAYRQYIPSSGNSTTGWKFLADTNWVVSKINSSTSNFLKKTGDTATGQIILDSNGIAFKANTWTNDLAPNRNYGGYLQVLDAYNASSDGGPTNYGTVLQINSKNTHWANQLWFPGDAEASKNGLYYRHMAYNETTYGEWNRLLTNKDVNIIQTQSSSNPTTLPVNQIFYSEIKGVAGTPTPNGLLFSVQGDDEGIQLWANSFRNELYYRTKWTSYGDWIKLATTSDIGNYLPLTGGKLSGQLTVEYAGSTPLIVNNSYTNGVDSILNFRVKGVNKTLVGYSNGNGPFIQDASNNRCIIVKSDGAYFGTMSSNTKLALITDIPTVSGYLPLTGGTMSGFITFPNSAGIVQNVNETSDYVRLVNWVKGTKHYSGQIGYHSTGGDGNGAIIIRPYYDEADGWSTAKGLYISKGQLLIDGASVATQTWVSSQGFLKTAPSISITTSGSGSVVTGISASGHTLTVTKGSASVSVSWNDITGKPSSFTPSAHTHEYIVGRYTGSGGVIAPGSIGTYKLQCNMMYTNAESSGGGYCDWILMNAYSWSDVPYATAIGVVKAATPSAYIMSGPNSTDKSTWVRKKLATTDEIPTRTSDLTNNSGFLTSSSLSGYATQSWVTSQGYLTSSSLSGYATQTWANGRFLPLSGGKLTGDLSFQEASGIILRPSNDSYISGIFADTQGNECVAVWAKNTVTRLRWHAGVDMSDGTANLMMGIIPDFEITKASGTAIGYIAGNEILHSNNYTSYTVTKTGGGASGTWGISISGNATTATTATTAATATNSTQLGGTAASSYVKANDNISRLTNDRNYVRSTSTLKVADIQVLDGGTPGSEAGILYIVLE